MDQTTVSRPTATATIEPLGHRATVPRDHAISVMIKLSTVGLKYADWDHVASVVHRALACFPSPNGKPGWRTVGNVMFSRRAGRTGGDSSVVVGVEGSVVWPGRPREDSMESLRAALVDDGYRVAIVESRECAESTCRSDVVVDWNRPSVVPPGWYSNLICGRHNYRTCPKCTSVYTLTSENSDVQAPSVHCAVCGVVMVEWGGSKIWSAELVTRGEAVSIGEGEIS
jgi:hypothetical protein